MPVGLGGAETSWEAISDRDFSSLSGLSMDQVRRGHSLDALYRRAKANIVRSGAVVERVGKRGARPLEIPELLRMLQSCRDRLKDSREEASLNFFKRTLKYFSSIRKGRIVIETETLQNLRRIAGLPGAAS
jgi:hypothetical protein